MKQTINYISKTRYIFGANEFKRDHGVCQACGEEATFLYKEVISDELAKQWKLSTSLQKAYNMRESMNCSACNCSARLRALAKALINVFNPGSDSLKKSIEEGVFNNKKIAEINACGDLHQFLKDIPLLAYSEYASSYPEIKTEDLQRLSYADGTFDIVLTSDTLEHIPDHKKAISEIYRILKTGGMHIFSVPLIFSRQTTSRANIKNGLIVNVQPPSFHGSGEEDNLVINEFGIDFLSTLEEAGFNTKIYFGNPINKNEVNYILVTRK